MSLTSIPLHTDVPGRADALARRLLDGGGAAALDAYRLGEHVSFLAHGRAGGGDVIVALRPEGKLAELAEGQRTDVRLDIVKQAPGFEVSIVAASLHVLGELSWVSDAEVASLGRLPETIASMADVDGIRIGRIELERAVLHDFTGPRPVSCDELLDGSQERFDEHQSYDLVGRYGQAALKDLCWSVMVGRVEGVTISKPPAAGLCGHTVDKVFCADVDRHGITLMLAGREETVLVYAAFDAPADTAGALEQEVDALFGAAALF